jgi:AraC family transcriptional regulator, transcriptional activator of the genes for pyochelin and ferripyochelin receptors
LRNERGNLIVRPSLNGAFRTQNGTMNTPTLEISYQDLDLKQLSVVDDAYEFSERKAHNTDIGNFYERSLTINGVRINEIATNFKRNCKVEVNDAGLANSMHLCMPLSGNVSGTFDEADISASLGPRSHHYLFTPGQEYDLMFDREVRLAHVEFGLKYFDSLLCPNERWSAELYEKLQRQEVVYSGGSLVCRSTNEIIQSILNCPLTGKLRKLFLEAKVIELITVQLQHYRALTDIPETSMLKKSELQLMEEVKCFLSSTFSEDHSLKSIALHFGINEFKLKKNFKQHFGETIFDFLFNLKMDHAYHLLRDSGKLVNEVSREVGYKNPNHFTTAFTKRFGVRPSMLRKHQ